MQLKTPGSCRKVRTNLNKLIFISLLCFILISFLVSLLSPFGSLPFLLYKGTKWIREASSVLNRNPPDSWNHDSSLVFPLFFSLNTSQVSQPLLQQQRKKKQKAQINVNRGFEDALNYCPRERRWLEKCGNFDDWWHPLAFVDPCWCGLRNLERRESPPPFSFLQSFNSNGDMKSKNFSFF